MVIDKRLLLRRAKVTLEALDSLSDVDKENLLRVVADLIYQEIKDGLDEKERGPFFELVEELYEERYPPQCYFCNHKVDPNADEFNRDDWGLCIFCQLKLANILTALGIDVKKLFPGMGERKIQKTRLK
jgi:hypothetical protein